MRLFFTAFAMEIEYFHFTISEILFILFLTDIDMIKMEMTDYIVN